MSYIFLVLLFIITQKMCLQRCCKLILLS